MTTDRSTRIAAASLNQIALDLHGNSQRIAAVMEEAKSAGCRVLCLPEMCLTGYGAEDMFLSPAFVHNAMSAFLELKPLTIGLVTCVGLPVLHHENVYNCVGVLADGQLAGFVAKQNLARDGLHYEPRWFLPWKNGEIEYLYVDETTVPIGDLLFDVDDWRLGFEICEDAWVADRPLRSLVERGANLILNPSASHFAFGKNKIRQQLVRDAVESHPVAYVYANLLGNEAGRAIYEGDLYIAAAGQIKESARRFSFHDHELIFADLVLPSPDAKNSDSRDKGNDLADAGASESWEFSAAIKEEEFARAVSLGLFDYVRKSRSQGMVISLSGGADSSAVACLCRLMLEFSLKDLGSEGLYQRLEYVAQANANMELNDWCQRLIRTAYQSTRNSTLVTRNAAQDVATGIASTHYEMDIDSLVQDYQQIVSKAIGRNLEWETDDIALQNIQARTRSPGIWMIANLFNALLLSTSNRSEAAVGYATMDGDTSGGLAPIAGIDKAFLRDWLQWMEDAGPADLGPFPFLKSVNQQQPTAELRPPAANQTDEQDLMPYQILDAIERASIRDKLLPLEIVARMEREFPSESREKIVHWVRRFFQLWCRNQWKRERYAPSFHLDDENLDPKTWCRFPILSGGFRAELNELSDE